MPHNYDYFLEQGGWGDQDNINAAAAAGSKKSKPKDDARSLQQQAQKTIRNLERRITATEDKISALEKEQKEAEAGLEAATQAADFDRINELAVKIGDVAQAIDEAFDLLNDMTKQLSQLKK